MCVRSPQARHVLPHSREYSFNMLRHFRPQWIVLLCALALLPALASRTAVDDPRTRKVITGGLDYLAYNQHKLGHWTAQGRYPTAMTALAGMALLSEGSTTTQGKYAENIRRAVDYLVRQSRPNGLIGDPRPRRPLHLRPRFLDAVPLAGAGRRGRRGPPRRAGRRAHARRAVHRPGANAGRRLGLRQREGRRRLRRRLDDDHAGARPPRLPQRGHSGAQGDHRQGRAVHQGLHAARRRRAIQLQGRRRPAGHHGRGHRLPVQRRASTTTISCPG